MFDFELHSVNDELTPGFLVGDVLAGIWQYMHQPYGAFREIVFDIGLTGDQTEYIGYGELVWHSVAPPSEPVSSGRNVAFLLN